MAFPDIWSAESCLVAITAASGNNIDFSPVIDSIDIDMGDKDFDSIATTRGGRLKKQTPEADTTITFEGYPVDINTAGAEAIQRFFTTRSNWDTSEPLVIPTTKILGYGLRDNFRVAILWCDSTSQTSATDGTPVTTEALRVVFSRCQLISVKPTMTDGALKFTFKFKCTPYKADGTVNIQWQSSDSTSSLDALSAYTG